MIAGRYREGGDAIPALSGSVQSTENRWSYEYQGLQFADRGGNDLIPGLWAQRKIGELLAQVRLSGPSAELIEEIVALSTRSESSPRTHPSCGGNPLSR